MSESLPVDDRDAPANGFIPGRLCIEGNDAACTETAVMDCPVHGDFPLKGFFTLNGFVHQMQDW